MTRVEYAPFTGFDHQMADLDLHLRQPATEILADADVPRHVRWARKLGRFVRGSMEALQTRLSRPEARLGGFAVVNTASYPAETQPTPAYGAADTLQMPVIAEQTDDPEATVYTPRHLRIDKPEWVDGGITEQEIAAAHEAATSDDDDLLPSELARYYTEEEMARMRRAVQATQSGNVIYDLSADKELVDA